jgi:hypothetical protein
MAIMNPLRNNQENNPIHNNLKRNNVSKNKPNQRGIRPCKMKAIKP